MTMYGRNDRNVFAALSSEEERRRANDEAANRPRPDLENDDGAGLGGEIRPGLRLLPWLLALAGLAVPLVGSGFALWPTIVAWLILLGLVWVVGRGQPQTRRGRIGFALVLLPCLFLAGWEGGWWLVPADIAWLVMEVADRGGPTAQPVAPKRAT
jgi:hypothetical protein